MSERTQKLIALRNRTDHDLLVIINRDLDRGFALVEVATTRQSPLFAEAVKAHETATALLPKIAGLSEDDRKRIEAKVRELGTKLERVPVYRNVCSLPASVAS